MKKYYLVELQKLEFHQKLFVLGRSFVLLGGGILTLSKFLELIINANSIDSYSFEQVEKEY